MQDKPNASQTIGVEMTASSLKGAFLSLRKGLPLVEDLFEIPLPADPDNVNLLYIAGGKKNLFKLADSPLLVSVLPGEDTLVRPLFVKLKKQKDIDDVLPFQTEPLIPFPLEEAVLDRLIAGKSKDGTHLTVLAAKKDAVKAHLDLFSSFRLTPEVVSPLSASIANFCGAFYQTSEPLFAVYLNQDSTTCTLVQDGLLKASQTIPSGLKPLLDAFKKDSRKAPSSLETLSFSEEEKKQYPELYKQLSLLKQQIKWLSFSLAKSLNGQKLLFGVVLGDGALYAPLAKDFLKDLNMSAPEKKKHSFEKSPAFRQEAFAGSIGAALASLSGSKAAQVDFRKGELAYPNPWKRLKAPITAFFALSFLLAAAAYFFSAAYLNYQEDRLKEKYLRLLSVSKKDLSSFEKEFSLKFPEKNPKDDVENLSLSSFTKDDLLARLSFLENEIQKTPVSFPLLPNVPMVSDVLAWLASHPNVAAKPAGEGGASAPLLKIENFTYTLIKRPDQKKQNEKYQVKIELEFTTEVPKLAREFHDALINPNPFVDSKSEIKWSSSKGKYRTSFFLKDKTIYAQNRL